MSMVKIDGQKIKYFREKQGLTQLYLATAVDVTTDTISRWENKRYPSIKKDNGLKLADALGVSLEELLETETQEVPAKTVVKKDTENTPTLTITTKRKRVFAIALGCLALLGGLSFVFFKVFFSSPSVHPFTAVRTAPEHFTAGQPFPVLLTVSQTGKQEASFILKEKRIKGAKILHCNPQRSLKKTPNPAMSWIAKTREPMVFSYIVVLEASPGVDFFFEGSVSTRNGQSAPITGVHKTVSGVFHWADKNRDNVINDEEVLTVYDVYSAVKGLEQEIDLIEEIWLGEGYSWNSQTQEYQIIE